MSCDCDAGLAAGVVAVLDYAGENDGGSIDVAGRPVVLSAVFATPPTANGAVQRLWVNGCSEINVSSAAIPAAATLLAVGFRASDPVGHGTRHYAGYVAEVVVFARALADAERAAWEAHLTAQYTLINRSATPCPRTAPWPFAAGSVKLAGAPPDTPPDTPSAALLLTTSTGPRCSGDATSPAAARNASRARTEGLATRAHSTTPSAMLDAGLAAAAAAVDGLFRNAPPVYVHGAMAWDVALVGWRSQSVPLPPLL